MIVSATTYREGDERRTRNDTALGMKQVKRSRGASSSDDVRRVGWR